MQLGVQHKNLGIPPRYGEVLTTARPGCSVLSSHQRSLANKPVHHVRVQGFGSHRLAQGGPALVNSPRPVLLSTMLFSYSVSANKLVED